MKNSTVKKVLVSILILLIVLLIISAALWFTWCYMKRTWDTSYGAGGKTPDNPSRGLYLQINETLYSKIEAHQPELRLFMLGFDIYDYRDCDIPEEKLQMLVKCLETFRLYDARCIFRAAYGFSEAGDNDADSLERIESHIEQIAPVLNEYKDVLLCVQAGFIGPYGEWRGSVYMNREDDWGKSNRNWLLERMTALLDEEIVIAVRRPRFIRDAMEVVDIERLCYHDDGLLGSNTDLGTFDDPEYSRAQEMEWLEKNIKSGANGGEMPWVNVFSRASRAVNEFPSMKITYLNKYYNTAVFDEWDKSFIDGENAKDYIVRHLGYRFDAANISAPVRMYGKYFSWAQCLEVTLKNNGFAPIDGRYKAEWVVVMDDGREGVIPCEGELGLVKSGGEILLTLNASDVWELYGASVGLRILQEGTRKTDRNCVEFATDEIVYKDGVNYLFYIDGEGYCVPYAEAGK